MFISSCVFVFQEGPHCAINEDEFFDAVDSALDKMEKEIEDKVVSWFLPVLISLTHWISRLPKHEKY